MVTARLYRVGRGSRAGSISYMYTEAVVGGMEEISSGMANFDTSKLSTKLARARAAGTLDFLHAHCHCPVLLHAFDVDLQECLENSHV